MAGQIEVPRAWEQLSVERLRGTLLVIGAPDVGKSTFARYLCHRLCATGLCVGYLDGDPGQSTLGPPATMTLALSVRGEDRFPPGGRVWRSFVGAVSPSGHMLPLLTGASRLARAAYAAGAEAVVYDTTGLVDPSRGGLALKLAKVDLLRPAVVFAIQRARELESLLIPLRRSRRVRVVDLRPVAAVRQRDIPARQAHRASRFAGYFDQNPGSEGVHPDRLLTVDWGRLAVLGAPRFAPQRLVALEDVDGFALGLGIVMEHDPQARQVVLYTPLGSLAGVDALRMGDLVVDPRTFRDGRLENRVYRS